MYLTGACHKDRLVSDSPTKGLRSYCTPRCVVIMHHRGEQGVISEYGATFYVFDYGVSIHILAEREIFLVYLTC